MSNKKIVLILLCSIILYIYLKIGITYVSIEDLDIFSSTSVDLTKNNSGEQEYLIAHSAYNYYEQKDTTSRAVIGSGESIGIARDDRQRKTNHRYIVALLKVMYIGEDMAKFGIGNLVDILFANQNMNDTAFLVVCKGNAIDILEHKVEGYPSSGDFIDGLIKHATNANFFSDQYKAIDVYVRMDSEGRNVVLPYIELKDQQLQITGMALFKKDKMVKKLDIEESRIMNMLREDNVRGILTLQENLEKYVDYSATTKRKVHVEKTEDNYIFTIDLSIKGVTVSNNLYNGIIDNPDEIKKFEEDMAKYVENICNIFIKKMQKECKVDCLQLGRVATAKFGRGTNVDWDEVVSNSDIIVNVKVKLEGIGRGDF